MKILLCSPLILDQYHSGYESKVKAFLHKNILKTTYHKSLSLDMLAAVTPPKHEIVILKTTYKNIEFTNKFDLVGIHCVTGDSPLAYKVADKFRKKGYFRDAYISKKETS